MRAGARAATSAVLILVASVRPLLAGPNGPELQIPFTAVAPTIDGEIDPLWAAAQLEEFGIDIFNVNFRALHDGRTLYLLFHDQTDEQFGLASGAFLYFDDEGGTPPRLWDADLSGGSCPAEQNRGEGRLMWRLVSTPPPAVQETFWPMILALNCNTYEEQNGSVAAMGFELGNGSRTEVALPLDGPSALEATIGEELGLYVEIYYAEGGPPVLVGQWPEFGALDTFANAALAALACNLPTTTFDPAFPLDWDVAGSGAATWKPSGTGGGECGVANQTGATGDSACVRYDGSLDGAASSLVSPWFSLAEPTSATLTYRGVYAEAPSNPSSGLVLEVTADGTTWSPLLDWTSNHGTSGGEAVTIDLSFLSGQSRIRLRWRFTAASGVLAGAQIDDVRLSCGPFLSSDAFESGLTTHWSAEAP